MSKEQLKNIANLFPQILELEGYFLEDLNNQEIVNSNLQAKYANCNQSVQEKINEIQKEIDNQITKEKSFVKLESLVLERKLFKAINDKNAKVSEINWNDVDENLKVGFFKGLISELFFNEFMNYEICQKLDKKKFNLSDYLKEKHINFILDEKLPDAIAKSKNLAEIFRYIRVDKSLKLGIVNDLYGWLNAATKSPTIFNVATIFVNKDVKNVDSAINPIIKEATVVLEKIATTFKTDSDTIKNGILSGLDNFAQEKQIFSNRILPIDLLQGIFSCENEKIKTSVTHFLDDTIDKY